MRYGFVRKKEFRFLKLLFCCLFPLGFDPFHKGGSSLLPVDGEGQHTVGAHVVRQLALRGNPKTDDFEIDVPGSVSMYFSKSSLFSVSEYTVK